MTAMRNRASRTRDWTGLALACADRSWPLGGHRRGRHAVPAPQYVASVTFTTRPLPKFDLWVTVPGQWTALAGASPAAGVQWGPLQAPFRVTETRRGVRPCSTRDVQLLEPP